MHKVLFFNQGVRITAVSPTVEGKDDSKYMYFPKKINQVKFFCKSIDKKNERTFHRLLILPLPDGTSPLGPVFLVRVDPECKMKSMLSS